MGQQVFGGYPDHGYAKGKVHDRAALTLAAGGTVANADLDTAGYTRLTLLCRLGTAGVPATAAGDLSVAVRAYEDDGTLVCQAALPTVATITTALTGGIAYSTVVIDLNGADKVQVRLQNNNASTALPGGTVSYYLKR